MQIYSDLLESIGITNDLSDSLSGEDTSKEINECINGPLIPHGYNNGMAIFTTDQIQIGLPEDFGFDQPYYVIEVQPNYATDYKYEQAMETLRPIHRYSRSERFKSVLNQICGQSGEVPDKVLAKLKINHTRKQRYTKREQFILKKISHRKTEIPINVKYDEAICINKIPKNRIWGYMLEMLKKKGLSKYYNRIPAILGRANYSKGKCTIPCDVYKKILIDFEKMNRIFPKIKHLLNRSYFPSLRYIAHMLMKKYNITTEWDIVVVKTESKVEALSETYKKMWAEIDKEEEEELIKFFSF